MRKGEKMIKSYFERLKLRIASNREKMRNYWNRSLNTSKNVKMSEGAQQIAKLITSAQKDQWRRNPKKK